MLRGGTMAVTHLIVLSIPGLRVRDVRPGITPTLHGWAEGGAMAELVPTFPCVTSCVQASMFTGAGPEAHGVIANGFYDRGRDDVAFWVGGSEVVAGEPVWEALRRRRPGFTSAVWHAQNIKRATADFIVTPAPIHEDDGTTKLWCYSKPEGLYPRLLEEFGHFPLHHYWGPLSGIESTRWILRAAAWLHEQHAPNFHWIYVPHLDYAGQKFGPASAQAETALVELDAALADFAWRMARMPGAAGVVYLVTGEYAMTAVSGVVYPNRILREAGLLAVRKEGQEEHIDLPASVAFAMVDHQFAHVYVRGGDAGTVERVGDLFRGRAGVAGVYCGPERAAIGIDHPRSGEVVLVAEETHWFAYFWWLEDGAAPAFARTVDIHRKPGYDPVELFFDPRTRGIPLDASLVRGSHGAPAERAEQRSTLIVSRLPSGSRIPAPARDQDVKDICLSLLGAG